MDFDEYQRLAALTDARPDRSDVGFPLLGLAGEVGTLIAEHKKSMRFGEMYVSFPMQVAEELGDLLWYAAALARTCGLSLNEIAEGNLRKTAAAWSGELPPAHVYDEGFPPQERLPRRASFTFTSDPNGVVRIFFGAEPVGHPVDDNAYEEDHYRFHDAFHLANAAVLGWSPLLRSLLKRKRKSSATIDRVEDGARAIFLEEGIVA
ncbi:MAG TPA: nucleotide pyrophosphohydrolase, partial [Actinomycetota bacterium]|nr:nucleotide pyrophosphohydrolase [Actinomycetota bacterium]